MRRAWIRRHLHCRACLLSFSDERRLMSSFLRAALLGFKERISDWEALLAVLAAGWSDPLDLWPVGRGQ